MTFKKYNMTKSLNLSEVHTRTIAKDPCSKEIVSTIVLALSSTLYVRILRCVYLVLRFAAIDEIDRRVGVDLPVLKILSHVHEEELNL